MNGQQCVIVAINATVKGGTYYATARLWDDGIIDPRQTRNILALGISAGLNAPVEEMRFGVSRM